MPATRGDGDALAGEFRSGLSQINASGAPIAIIAVMNSQLTADDYAALATQCLRAMQEFSAVATIACLNEKREEFERKAAQLRGQFAGRSAHRG